MKLSAAFGAVAGPVLCFAIHVAPLPAGLTVQGKSALAVLALCVIWWLFSPVALPVTSLMGLALLPALGALPTADALALFGNPSVFFVIGVFLVAAVMHRTGLSLRLTLLGLRRASRSEDILCFGVLVLSWALCAVVVSHAVAAIMLPIVLEIIRALDLGPRSRTARRLLLSMAWGTVAGSNLTLLSSARATLALDLYSNWRTNAGLDADPIGFMAYASGAAPVSLCSMLAAGIVLRLSFPPEGLDIAPAVRSLNAKVKELGSMSQREWLTLSVVVGMVLAMVMAGPEWLSVVALIVSCTLFLLQVLRWEDAERYVNWGVALMYGGAIAVGGALDRTGATAWLADVLLPDTMGPWTTVALIAILAAALTEVVSNAAVIAVILPISLPLAMQAGLDPHLLVWLVPLSAGFAFILPTSTPAMAMVFGTGYLQVRHTAYGGVITVVSWACLLLMAAILWPLLGLEIPSGALP
jgi:sodium-dependent dicarboxylate transporter 2/3/5